VSIGEGETGTGACAETWVVVWVFESLVWQAVKNPETIKIPTMVTFFIVVSLLG
jgi:hypothetical protein